MKQKRANPYSVAAWINTSKTYPEPTANPKVLKQYEF